jgi:tetratricopeptide (TPR) repeat protein
VTSTFVGRDPELEQLRGLLGVAAEGSATTVLVEGIVGMGKEALLDEARARAERDMPESKFIRVYCYEATGSQDPFGPLAEALQVLAQEQKRDLAHDAMSIIKEYGPDLLELVPVVGSTLSTAARIGGGIVGRVMSREDSEIQARWENIPLQFERTLIALASQHRPLVLVIQDAQWIDGKSVEVLHRLARHHGQQNAPIAVLLELAPVPEDHPLRELQRESPEELESIELGPLTERDIEAYVLARYGLPLSADLPAWLLARSEGKPLYVTEYLDLLEQEKVIRVVDGRPELVGDLSLVERRLPRDVAAVTQQRIGRLDEESRKLLQVAAIHGQQFLSSTLAEMRGEPELDLVTQLEEIERQHRLVSFTGVERWRGTRSALYSFESGIQAAFYESVSRYRRIVLHRQVAERLEAFATAGDDDVQPPRKWLLEIARHYGEAEEPVPAAENYLNAAQSAFGDGGLREVVAICTEALAWVRSLPVGTPENDHLRAEIIRLLLDAREIVWDPAARPEDERALVAMAAEAEAAAARTGDVKLQSEVRHARGKLAMRTGKLQEGLALFEQSLALAEQAGDTVGQLMILCDLGHNKDSEDLSAGAALLRRAEELYRTGAVVPGDRLEKKLLERHHSRLKTLIGVSEFDLGHYGEAERWLREGIKELRDHGEREALAWAMNFAGQLHIAAGQYESAEQELGEAIELTEGSMAAIYHRSLLGKLYLEWQRAQDASVPFTQAWAAIPSGGLPNSVAPLVRNAQAEYLVSRAGPGDADQAEQLLEQTVAEAEKIGFQRTLISALSLLARLTLDGGRTDEALDWSTRAVTALQAKSWFTPTVRTEEVLFVHSLATRAGGRDDEAERALQHAREVLEGKASSIPDTEARQVFLERVPLSRQITSATEAATPA